MNYETDVEKVHIYVIIILYESKELNVMNQEDYELYNKLSILRNNLQEQFYDYNNSRKPTICTEDALRLLVKYKPTVISSRTLFFSSFTMSFAIVQ